MRRCEKEKKEMYDKDKCSEIGKRFNTDEKNTVKMI